MKSRQGAPKLKFKMSRLAVSVGHVYTRGLASLDRAPGEPVSLKRTPVDPNPSLCIQRLLLLLRAFQCHWSAGVTSSKQWRKVGPHIGMKSDPFKVAHLPLGCIYVTIASPHWLEQKAWEQKPTKVSSEARYELPDCDCTDCTLKR